MKAGPRCVEFALDHLFTVNPKLVNFNRNGLRITLHSLGVTMTRDQVSQALADYREAQALGITKYSIFARDYGPGAMWFVVNKASPTPQQQSAIMGHIDHIARDAARRLIRDLNLEYVPSLAAMPGRAASDLDLMAKMLRAQMVAAVSVIKTHREAVAASTKIPTDLRKVKEVA